MGIPKEKIWSLINELPEQELGDVVIFLEDIINKRKEEAFNAFISNPLKIEGKFEMPSREERNVREHLL